ncbi:MAG: gliding motility-associated protein GldE [Flavobacteriales bacterium]
MEPSSIEPFGGFLFTINSISLPVAISLLVMAVLLISSALISGSEVAFFSIDAKDREVLNSEKDPKSLRVLDQLVKPKKLLATILIANNFINIAIVILSTYIINNLISFGPDEEILNFIITVVVATFLILLVGEVIPKVYATNNSLKLAKFMASPIFVVGKICSPLSNVLVRSTSFIDKRIKKSGTEISVNDLDHALEITDIEGVTDEDKKILEGIVKFGETDVKQIMKSRVDVVAFDESNSFSELLPQIIENGYSRIPIFKESFDNVSGVLYVKDLLPHIDSGEFDWRLLLREPFFVPESKKIDDLLRQFQESKVHMAIVVDEYGGTSGIVTLEDVIEEILGEISDEFDDDDIVYSKIDENNYVFEGKISLVDMYKIMDIEGEIFEDEKGEADTLAGFLIEKSGKIMKKNERIKFGDYLFEVEAADKRRIKQVKITRKPETENV